MKRFFALILFVWLAGALPARADGVDDQYVRIYNVIQEADALEANGRSDQALRKYLEAQRSLLLFQRLNPSWNVKVVGFRLNYLSSKIPDSQSQSPVVAPPLTTSRPTTAPAYPPSAPSVRPTVAQTKPAPNAIEQQVNGLKEQVRQLQADKILLEAKLKESFSVQPSSIDPRELARAQDRIKNLQKENDLLKVDLNAVKSRPASGADGLGYQQAQLALAEANRRLMAQTEKANSLAQEKVALQNKLNTTTPGAWNASAMEGARKELEEANRQLALQKEATAKLGSEKESLLARLKTLSADNDAAAALRAENQLLKKQLADLRSSSPGGRPTDAQAAAQIAALQSDKDILRLEKAALENRVRQLSASVAASGSRGSTPIAGSTVLPAAGRGEDALHIRQLEQERDDLQKKLDTANKELYGRNSKTVANRILEMENQMVVLRARLQVFESRQVPYSTEELAMFKRPEMQLSVPDPKVAKHSIRELPSGSATLVADAQRYFSNRQYDRAEEKYQQILHQDEKNALTLANLAEIQFQRKHYDEAEKSISKAISLAPDDAFNLGVLGKLKFQQEKYEEALDALSKAAKLDPQNPEIQNLLGLTLSEKGLRVPAETALRKAVQLEPGYGEAHANLAVIYVNQQPPLMELARWHYQKALAAGCARNAFLERALAGQQASDSKK